MAAYAALLGADRSIIAWEWLRRDPAYRAAAHSARAGSRDTTPEAWGLHAFEAPDLAAPLARPVWTAARHRAVLVAEPGDPGNLEQFDLCRFQHLATLLRHRDDQHLLLSDGLRAIRIDLAAGRFDAGPLCLRYLLEGLASAERSLWTLGRFLALQRSGRFSRTLHPPEARARRWILMLRTADALAAGATQREIAVRLLGPAASEPRWRSAASSARSQAQRLVRAARRMSAGAYRGLL